MVPPFLTIGSMLRCAGCPAVCCWSDTLYSCQCELGDTGPWPRAETQSELLVRSCGTAETETEVYSMQEAMQLSAEQHTQLRSWGILTRQRVRRAQLQAIQASCSNSFVQPVRASCTHASLKAGTAMHERICWLTAAVQWYDSLMRTRPH